MGVVYVALAHGPGGFAKLKVIKRLRAEIADEPRALRMFLEEAKLAARLLHPNVVQTNEVGFDGKHYFIEMEYLEGQPLSAIMRRGSSKGGNVPLPLGLWIVAQALAGLHHAHELRDLDGKPLHVVHRDVSPHNVFVTYDGGVKVLDFGIAKAADSQGETTTGLVKGKATYMAPEQAAHRPLDRRADVFAAGVMLWEILTGRRLWEGLDDFEIFLKLREGPVPPPSTACSDVAPELEAICMRAVAMRPEDRFATAAELQSALEEHLETSGARVGSKALAKWMNEALADKRAQVKAEIEEQIRRGSADVRTSDVPVRIESGLDRGREPEPSSPVTESAAQRPQMTTQREPSRGGGALRSGTLAALTIAAIAVAGIGALLLRNGTKPWLAHGASAVTSAPASVGPPHECTTNTECVRAHGGKPWICRKDAGACVPLDSEDCHVLADAADVENDRTLWLGTMYPTTGPKASLGSVCERGVDLGRRDFAQITHGLPALATDGPPRPIGLVACNDADETVRPARHLAEEVGVPAVIGFGSSHEVVDLATQVFLPRRVMVLATENQSTLITSIPHPAGVPRLVFRTTLSEARYQIPVTLIVPEVIEPRLREAKIVRPDAPTKVALVRPSSTAALSTADQIFGSLRYNGKSALENGQGYREFVFQDLEHTAEVVRGVVDFRPHVVIFSEGQGDVTRPVLEPIEAAWNRNLPYRPYYVATSSLLSDDLLRFVGTDSARRHRFFGVDAPATTMANARLTRRYSEVFDQHITPGEAPAAAYDAFYLVAYSAFASRVDSPRGLDLAAAVGQLVPPGKRVEVGPTRILEAIDELRTAQRIDLIGTMTPLDFDLKTGESPGDLSVMCLGVDDAGRASEAVDSGVRYDAASGTLVGSLRCP
jgi:serine/threonine-protein kinase